MGRRLGLFAAALVVALLGTSAVFAYVSRVESRATAGQQPVEILVAAARIPEGTTADAAVAQKLVSVQSLPRKSVPEGALTNLQDVRQLSAVSDIYAGEVLLRPKFADARAKTGRLLIPGDRI